MNLYCLQPSNGEWCCYVFAETPNKAKTMLTGYFDDTPYTDWRYQTIKKGVSGEPEICDDNCQRLADLNIYYAGPDDDLPICLKGSDQQ